MIKYYSTWKKKKKSRSRYHECRVTDSDGYTHSMLSAFRFALSAHPPAPRPFPELFHSCEWAGGSVGRSSRRLIQGDGQSMKIWLSLKQAEIRCSSVDIPKSYPTSFLIRFYIRYRIEIIGFLLFNNIVSFLSKFSIIK